MSKSNVKKFSLIFLYRSVCKRLSQFYESWFLFDIWNVALVKTSIQDIMKNGLPSDSLWLAPLNHARFFADPFAIAYKGELKVFVEDYHYFQGIGKIRELVVSSNFQIKESRIIIRPHVHMSYPSLLQHNDKLYCIPETSRAGKVYLYEKLADSDNWEITKVLLDEFPAIDPTLFRYEDLWWIFCTKSGRDVNIKLYAWYSKELDGPWSPHPLNPIKCDIRSSRPAGPVFEHEGELFRPAQDCSQTYGGSITINRVRKLSPSEFEEEFVSNIEADPKGPYPDGIHTICTLEDMTVIDSKKKQFSIMVPFSKIGHRIYSVYNSYFNQSIDSVSKKFKGISSKKTPELTGAKKGR